MLNKMHILRFYLRLPDRIQQNRLILRIIDRMVASQKATLQHEIIESRWQIMKLKQKIAETRNQEPQS